MVTVSIKDNFPQVQAQLDQMMAGIREKAVASTINKVLDQGRTQMARSIAKEYAVTVSYARERLRIKRAFSKGKITVEGSLSGIGKRSTNVIRFMERSTTLAEGRRRAKAGTQSSVFVKVKRSGGKKEIKGAFIGNKGRTVFIREGKGRTPIKPVNVIDVPQMFNAKRINSVVLALMLERFPTVFAREARYFTQRLR